MVALEAKTGKLRWYFQFTPHDLWDWDAQEPLALVDAPWQGKPGKLLIQANRNGFYYVLDRTNGKLLLGKPFVDKLTWASGLSPTGRPVLNVNQEPAGKGTDSAGDRHKYGQDLLGAATGRFGRIALGCARHCGRRRHLR